MLRRAALACLAVAAAATAARAEPSEPLPAGRLEAIVGVRTGTGSLYNSIGTGLVYGFEAAYSPLRAPQTVGLGLTWSLLWSRHWSDSARIVDELKMVELDVGVRVRYR